jgi:hypothetical protein
MIVGSPPGAMHEGQDTYFRKVHLGDEEAPSLRILPVNGQVLERGPIPIPNKAARE